MSARRSAAALLVGALATVTTGCQVTTAVGVDAKADGSGTVRVAVGLDKAAAGRVPNLARELEVDDLVEAGWTIVGPRKEDDGRTWIRASKPFDDPDDAKRVIEEISGEGGPFADFRLTRKRSFLRTETTFTGRVDLTAGIEAFGDDQLRERLGGSSIGVDPEELSERIGTVLNRLFTFKVAARLPGDVESNAPVEADGGAEWRPVLGEEVTLRATATALDTRRLVGLALAGFAAVALVMLALLRRARRRADPAWR